MKVLNSLRYEEIQIGFQGRKLLRAKVKYLIRLENGNKQESKSKNLDMSLLGY